MILVRLNYLGKAFGLSNVRTNMSGILAYALLEASFVMEILWQRDAVIRYHNVNSITESMIDLQSIL